MNAAEPDGSGGIGFKMVYKAWMLWIAGLYGGLPLSQ
jgi:hypothetical protein